MFLDRWGHPNLATSERLLKILLCIVFIVQIGHYGKFMALHKLISIVFELTNQIK